MTHFHSPWTPRICCLTAKYVRGMTSQSDKYSPSQPCPNDRTAVNIPTVAHYSQIHLQDFIVGSFTSARDQGRSGSSVDELGIDQITSIHGQTSRACKQTSNIWVHNIKWYEWSKKLSYPQVLLPCKGSGELASTLNALLGCHDSRCSFVLS